MATEKVGIYRKYHGPVPVDASGQPVPSSEWPRKRAFRWAVRWFGVNGARYSKSFATRKEAERFAEHTQSDVRQGKGDPPPSITLEAFAREHEKIMRGQVAPKTLDDQVRALRMFAEHVSRNTLLRSVRPRDAESYVAARLAAGARVATVNKDIRTLKRVFNLAIEPRGYLVTGQNPFARIKQRKQSVKPIRYVKSAELQAVLSATDDIWWRALLSVAYTTGARLGEMLNLTWADVDFGENRIRVVSKAASGRLTEWEPKDHEGRLLPVPPEAMDLLIRLQAESSEGCPYVFMPAWRWEYIRRSRQAGQWPDGRALLNNLSRGLATLRKRACVAKFTYHDLRRSCVTNWAGRLPIHVVQKLAGHSSIETTRQYYLSVQEDDLTKARLVQSDILKSILTDPQLTHLAGNGHSDGHGKDVKLLVEK